MAWGHWRATLGLRHDWTHQSGGNATTFGDTDFGRDDEATTGHASVGYAFDNGPFVYLAHATSFLPQIGTDVDGNPLRPTRGRQWELGAKWQPSALEGLFTAALYDLTEYNRTTVVGPGYPAPVAQTGEVNIRGLELEGVAELGAGWTLKGAYTFADSRISGDNDGNELANTPRHSAALWLAHEIQGGIMEGLTLSGGAALHRRTLVLG
ncbi:Outer membrane receptor [Rubellimicrobium thermophilum DSM 16684]|uniref:Outer membrane receptor n=1 Tax=Rubellimicrobium thermophilum DSM 16684 TaxID=1123069 RepID=S9SB89_9RHOB|nr:Outer membrane receptor [Rubellimicrobium thermophilum DSM 16684]